MRALTRVFHHGAALVMLLAGVPLLAAPQTTFRVDDGGGPGVDFTAIQDAIDAAVPGDVILVAAGVYDPFVLDRGVRVVGSIDPFTRMPDARVQLGSSCEYRIQAVPAGELAVVADVLGCPRVQDCAGKVVLDNLTGYSARLERCDDLRLRLASFRELDVSGARGHAFELAELDVDLRADLVGTFTAGGPRVLVAMCRLRGAAGSDDASCVTPAIDPLPGAHARRIDQLVISGRPSDFLVGGIGVLTACGFVQIGAPGLMLEDTAARITTVRIGSLGPGGTDVVLDASSTLDRPRRRDPVLELEGWPVPGAPIAIKLSGEPGDLARIEYGLDPERAVAPGRPALTQPVRFLELGPIPANATSRQLLAIPASARPGDVLVFSGSALEPGGPRRPSNGLVVVVRE